MATDSTDEFLQTMNHRPAHSALLSVTAKDRSSTLDGAARLNLRCYEIWLKARQGFQQRVRAKDQYTSIAALKEDRFSAAVQRRR